MIEHDNIFLNLGVRVHLNQPDDFLKIKETLTRMGVASYKDKKLWQSCHILHKRGQYAIMHFKEMFVLDGKNADAPVEDIRRRNAIVKLLAEWGLVRIVDEDRDMSHGCVDMSAIKILPFREKENWELIPKYTVGNKPTPKN